MLRRNGPVSVTEATDERGRSLLPPNAPAEQEPGPVNRSRQAMYEGDAIQVIAIVVAPDPSATVIRRLRGKVPVIAFARGSDPIVIPLNGEGVLGRPYSTRDLTLVVDEVSLRSRGSVLGQGYRRRQSRGSRDVRNPRPDPARLRCVQRRRSAGAPGASRRHRPAPEPPPRLTDEKHRRRPLRVDRRALLRRRSWRRSWDLEDTHPLRTTVLRIRPDRDGNPLRFPRHSHPLNQAGVLPMAIAASGPAIRRARGRTGRGTRPGRCSSRNWARPSRRSGQRQPNRSNRSGVRRCRPWKEP